MVFLYNEPMYLKKNKALQRPETTLFMLISVDGKISTGDSDTLDFDQDIPKFIGAKEGLYQYYDLEKKTDFYSLNTGKVFAKIGLNKPQRKIIKIPVNFIVIDNKPHLTEVGIKNILAKSKKLYLVTTNRRHPAFRVTSENLEILHRKGKIDFRALFTFLRKDVGVSSLTIQSGGTLNAVLLGNGLIDHLSLVVAPMLVGGKHTPSLIDGESLHFQKDLKDIKVLKLRKVSVLKHSYLHLEYDVLKS